MSIQSSSSRLALVCLLACTISMTAGCGKLVSGANLKPTVKYLAITSVAPVTDALATPATTADVSTAEGIGTLKGKVELVGAFTTLPPLYAKGGDVKDADVCAAVEAPNESILSKDGGLANVFIYLRKAPKVVAAVVDAPLIFDQKNCVFTPHAMVIRVGQTVKVLNSDKVAHNTHTYGKKTTAFNSIVSPNEEKGVPLVYKQAEQEPISVGCDIHPWMKAYHLPIDHPFVAVSAPDGTFEIKDLPAGKHEFKVWHEAAGLIEKGLVVTIQPGDNELPIKVSSSQLGK
jgi:plastocyanin